MPAKLAPLPAVENTLLASLGGRLRLARKRRGRSAEDVAAEAGITRVTLRRVESGQPAVMMGTYLRVMAALGLAQDLRLVGWDDAPSELPQDAKPPRARNGPNAHPRIRLAEYPMLREIAWSTDPKASLTPEEAFALYERNWRHLDHEALEDRERALIERLTANEGNGVLLV